MRQGCGGVPLCQRKWITGWSVLSLAFPCSPATGFRCFGSASTPGRPRGVAPTSWFRGFLAASASRSPWGVRIGRFRDGNVSLPKWVVLQWHMIWSEYFPWGAGRLRRPTESPTEVFGGLTATSESFGAAPGGLTKLGRPGESPAALLRCLVAAPGALGALVSHMGVASAHELSQSSPAMVRSRDGSQRFPRPFGGVGGVHVIEVSLRLRSFPGLSTAVPGGMWSLAAGDM